MISLDAELVWTAELQRRQEAHVDEVRRRLSALPEGQRVDLRYGPGLKAEGIFVGIHDSFVRLRLIESWTRWVPLLQIDSINGVELETANRLERPQVAGVIGRAVGSDHVEEVLS